MKFWTTAKGIKIRIADMDDGHLINTIKMIEDRVLIQKMKDRYEIANRPVPKSEQAKKLLQKDLVFINKRTPDETWPMYKYLVKEKKNRKLK